MKRKDLQSTISDAASVRSRYDRPGYQNGVTIPDDEFEMMLARARRFRKRVDELGTLSSPVTDGYVRDRLRYRPDVNSLPPGQAELADEIVALLQMPSLSPQQANRIEREFFET
jgi:hypothetical protein